MFTLVILCTAVSQAVTQANCSKQIIRGFDSYDLCVAAGKQAFKDHTDARKNSTIRVAFSCLKE